MLSCCPPARHPDLGDPDAGIHLRNAQHQADLRTARFEAGRCPESPTHRHLPEVVAQECGPASLRLRLKCSVCGCEMTKRVGFSDIDWTP